MDVPQSFPQMWMVLWTTSGRRVVLVQEQMAPGGWGQFQDVLRAGVSKATGTHGHRASKLDFVGETPTLVAPSEFHLRWVRDKHGELIESAYRDVFGINTRPVFKVVEPEPGGEPTLPSRKRHRHRPSSCPSVTVVPATNLISRYRFESFVVGQSNRFAGRPQMAVAEQPGAHYNLLFIYGGAGLGKTHLLNAVGHQALEMYPNLVVRYVSSENFLNDFIDSIRRKRLMTSSTATGESTSSSWTTSNSSRARSRYSKSSSTPSTRSMSPASRWSSAPTAIPATSPHSRIDCAAGSNGASHRHPASGCGNPSRHPEEKRRIRPATCSTRGTRAHRSVGLGQHPGAGRALTRVTAWSALNRRDIDLETAERVLRDIVTNVELAPLGPDTIIRATATAYGFTVEDVLSPSRRQPLVLCRQISMYLCRELTDLSLPKIGEHFKRDHTTVLHSVEKVKRIPRSDRAVFDRVTQLTQDLRKGGEYPHMPELSPRTGRYHTDRPHPDAQAKPPSEPARIPVIPKSTTPYYD